jgi:3-oxoacyl-[acyl-carrier protein] reductase
MGYGPFRDLEPRRWRGPVEINVFGGMNCVHAVLPGMRGAGWGHIVQISSGVGRTGLSMGVSLYGAGKSGIEGFIRHLSQEEAPAGITANVLAIGVQESARGQGAAGVAAGIPVGRRGRPCDVGAAVAFLASEEASWLTGQTIDLNGGTVTRLDQGWPGWPGFGRGVTGVTTRAGECRRLPARPRHAPGTAARGLRG